MWHCEEKFGTFALLPKKSGRLSDALMKTSSSTYNEKRQRIQAGVLVIPAAFWLIVFFALPLVVVLVYSFLTGSG